jgi:hypothetical protein
MMINIDKYEEFSRIPSDFFKLKTLSVDYKNEECSLITFDSFEI